MILKYDQTVPTGTFATGAGLRPGFGGYIPKADRERFMAQAGSSLSLQQKQLEVVRRQMNDYPRLADSIALQSRWRTALDPYYFERKRDDRSRLLSMRNGLWEEMESFIYRMLEQWRAMVANELTNFDFFYGYQWSDEELKRLQAAKLIPHVADYMSRWIRTLVGEERGAVTMYNFTTDDPAFKDVADMYNQVIPRICRLNEWPDRSSDMFFNYMVGQRGFASIRRDPFDPFRKIVMKNERPQEFMADYENAWDGTLDGCNYLLRVFPKDLEELIVEYPEFEPELRNYNESTPSHEELLSFTLNQPKVQPTAFKRLVQMPTKFQNRNYFRTRRSGWVSEFYRRGALKQFSVRDGNFNIDHDFDTLEQAVDFYRNMRDSYKAQNIAMTGDEGIDLIVPPFDTVRQVTDKIVWCGNILLDCSTTRTARLPYIAAHNEFHHGQCRGWFQLDNSNQQLRNRMHVWWDMYLGGIKGKMFVLEDVFPKGTTFDEQQELLRDPQKAVIIKRGSLPPGMTFDNFVKYIQPPDPGQLSNVLYSASKETSNFSNGGLNMVGDAEFAGQSDKLRRGLQVSAQTGTVDLMKGWERAERRAAQQLVYETSFFHPTVLLEYTNSDSRFRFVPLLQREQHSIELDQIAIEVTEVLAGPTKRDQQRASLLEIGAMDPKNMAAVLPDIYEMSDLPQSRIDRLQDRIGKMEEAEAAAADREQQRLDYAEEMKWNINERRQQVEERRVATEENPPVKTTMSFRAGDPGPEAKASILSANGVPADPQHVAASDARQRLLQQDADNLTQEEFNQRDLEYQRNLSKIYPQQQGAGKKPAARPGQKSEGVRSAKDRNARRKKGTERVK